MKNAIEALEQQEMIQKLIDNGYGELVDALLSNERQCFTRSARANKCGICRVLSWKTKQLEDAFAECRKLLSKEFDQDS